MITLDERTQMSDHDLLVTLHEHVKSIRIDIADLKLDISGRLQDHETRLRRLELWGFIAIGFLYAIQLYLTFIK